MGIRMGPHGAKRLFNLQVSVSGAGEGEGVKCMSGVRLSPPDG